MNEQQAPQQMPQQASSPGITYQTTVLTPGMVETLVVDDSPQILWDKLWAFLGIDIPVADIKEWDFKNILDFVDVTIFEILEEYPEHEWENVAIVEYETIEENGKYKAIPKRAYKISPLHNLIRAKTYLKMCRAREGFTLRALTESRQFIEEKSNIPPTAMIPQSPIPQEGKKGWRFL